MKKTFEITAFFFLLIITFLLALFLVLPDEAYSKTEKRNLEQLPAFSPDAIETGQFMDSMEDYSEDQFPFRDLMMSFKSGILSLIGQRESQGVYLCENDRLIEKFEMPKDEDTEEKLQAILDFAGRYTDESRKNAPDFYFLLVPTAVSVYEEDLPMYAPSGEQESYIRILENGLEEGLEVVSLMDLFRERKEETEIYYRTDHHWTTKGAFMAYEVLKERMGLETEANYTFKQVSDNFKGSLTSKSGYSIQIPDEIYLAEPEKELLYTVTDVSEGTKTSSIYVSEKLESDDPYQVFLGGNYPLLQIETENYTERKLLIIKDSYANALIPFFLTDFSQITVLDPRYYYDDLDALMGANYTDVLFLYNANTFAEDNSLVTVLKNQQ